MKKGFTLVELLAVITVFAILIIIILPRVSKHIDDSKEDLYKTQIDSIERATKDYLLSDRGKEERKRAQERTIYIELAKLQEYDYLEKEKIKNPLDGEIMNGVIRVTYRNNNYVFEYLEMNVDEAEQQDYTVERYILEKSGVQSPTSTEDGLYASKVTFSDMDQTTSTKNVYYYRGNNPNNYMKLQMGSGSTNAEMWNIVSIDTTNKVMKLVRTGKKAKTVWSETDTAANLSLSDDSLKMHQYLNTTVFNGFSDVLKRNLKTPKWMLGEVDSTSTTLDVVMGDEDSKRDIRGTAISLLSVSDYMNASLANSCRNTSFDAQCVATNWLTNLVVNEEGNTNETGYYLRNTVKGQRKVWAVTSSGLTTSNVTNSMYVYPVIYVPTSLLLDSSMDDTSSNPIGSVSNPYILRLY